MYLNKSINIPNDTVMPLSTIELAIGEQKSGLKKGFWESLIFTFDFGRASI